MSQHPFLVTGATDGIGFETALGIARAGRPVLVHGRSPEKAKVASQRLNQLVPGNLTRPVWADYSSLDQVRDLGRHLQSDARRLAGVIHNAGALFTQRTLTADGWESTWQINHLAPFVLHQALSPLLASGARVVWVSSMLHAHGTIPWDDFNGATHWDGKAAYNATKLANALTAFRIARMHSRSSLSCFALHPGVVGTKMLMVGFGMRGVPPVDGARTSVFAALDPSLAGKTGLYLDASREAQPSAAARDEALQDRLWEWTVSSLGL
jgi:NAD(P)-dependent dehydrogenase (short-subunit alcohol dehydrogenase family)